MSGLPAQRDQQPSHDDDIRRMRAFESIPPRHGVAVLTGCVIVYDELALSLSGLENGAYYVLEYQRPVAGMSWDMFYSGRRTRLETSRDVVRLERFDHDPKLWLYRHTGNFWVSGPMDDIKVAEQIIGKVVGMYCPTS
jgi:hypothetical protein